MKKIEIENLKSGSKRYRNLAIILAFLGFIFGVVFGATNPKIKISEPSDYDAKYEYDEEFNAELMGNFWGITAGAVITLSFMYSVCYRLDLLVEKKDK